MQTVILPPSQRRLRHVESICVRNAAALVAMVSDTPSPAASSGATQAARTRGQSRVSRPRSETTTTRLRSRTDYVDPTAASDAASPTILMAKLPTTLFQLIDAADPSMVIHESEAQCHTLHPTFLPLPAAARKWANPQIRFLLWEVTEQGERKVTFECAVDMRKLQFQAKNLAAFTLRHDHTTVLFKCEDGVFAIGSSRHHVAEPTTSGLSATASPIPKSPDGGTHDSETDNWDVVDGDVVRDEERRMQVAQRLSSADVVSLTAASSTLAFAQSVIQNETTAARSLVAATLLSREADALIEAKAALEQLSSAFVSSSLRSIAEEADAATKRIEEKRRLVAAKRAAVADDDRNVTTCEPWRLPPREAEVKAAAWIKARQATILSQITAFIPFNGTTIAGFALPVSEPETDEHNIAIGIVVQVFATLCRIFFHEPRHPVALHGSRSTIREHAADESVYPLYVVTKTDRPGFSTALRLLVANIAVAAHAVHGQRQADGLPLGVAFQKLLSNQ